MKTDMLSLRYFFSQKSDFVSVTILRYYVDLLLVYIAKYRKTILISIFLFLLYQQPISAENHKTVLVMMSASDRIILDHDREYVTGVFLNELYIPVLELKRQGFFIKFATPQANRAYIDPESLKIKYWKSKESLDEALEFTQFNSEFLNPISLETALKKESEFVSILVPGGQGLMSDLLTDPLVPKILELFHRRGKAIGLVCHAPALLTTYTSKPNPFFGYKVNSVTGIEEWYIETFVMRGTPKMRNIAKRLQNEGLKYESSFFPGRGYAVKDRNLVTSQNPFSGAEFTKLYLEALEEFNERSLP